MKLIKFAFSVLYSLASAAAATSLSGLNMPVFSDWIFGNISNHIAHLAARNPPTRANGTDSGFIIDCRGDSIGKFISRSVAGWDAWTTLGTKWDQHAGLVWPDLPTAVFRYEHPNFRLS